MAAASVVFLTVFRQAALALAQWSSGPACLTASLVA